MSKGMLIDTTRCMGCRGCQVACKQWNDLPAELDPNEGPGWDIRNTGSYQNPPALSAYTWTMIEYREIEEGDRFFWHFLKRQCMHCEHPACVSACPVEALQKLPDGPVVYNEGKCIGCRYCMFACPFGVPTFQWDKSFKPLIRKCNFCADRLASGYEPACAKTCPSQAILFGERDEMLWQARRRIQRRPEKYVQQIYGEKEGGGTSVMFLSAVPFDMVGLPSLGPEPVPALSEAFAVYGTPVLAVAAGAFLSAMYWIVRRREQVRQAEVAARAEKEE